MAYRLFADVLNDVAILLEIVAPVSRQYFRLIVCTAGVSKVCQPNQQTPTITTLHTDAYC